MTLDPSKSAERKPSWHHSKSKNGRSSGRPEWVELKRFTDCDIAVSVTGTKSGRPSYAVHIGSARPDGTVTRSVPIKIEGTFRIKITPIAKIAMKLLEQAEEWISTQAATQADDDLDRRIEKETAQLNSGRLVTRVTGKTAREKAKRSGKPV